MPNYDIRIIYEVCKNWRKVVDIMKLTKKTKNEFSLYDNAFERYKSNICHVLKEKGDLDFIFSIIENGDIHALWSTQKYPECFYLLAMVDYLSRINDIPLCSDFNEIRRHKMKHPVYPIGITIQDAVAGTNTARMKSLAEAIPEFKEFNIIECEVRDVC